MKKTACVVLVFVAVCLVSACSPPPRTSMPMFSTVHDGIERKSYLVVGRIVNNFNQPVSGCDIYLVNKNGWFWNFALNNTSAVAVTDAGGNFSFTFEPDGGREFHLYVDARDQGYQARLVDFGYLMKSSGFQYTGNSPVIVNAVLEYAKQ